MAQQFHHGPAQTLLKELSETCRVSCQNKFVKLVHLVGFIVKKCHDTQSHERKQPSQVSIWTLF
jgi:hypothetical protein